MDFEKDIENAIKQAEETFKKIREFAPEKTEAILKGAKGNEIFDLVLENHKKNFKGDYEAYLKKVGISPDDNTLVRIFKINEFEKKHKNSSDED